MAKLESEAKIEIIKKHDITIKLPYNYPDSPFVTDMEVNDLYLRTVKRFFDAYLKQRGEVAVYDILSNLGVSTAYELIDVRWNLHDYQEIDMAWSFYDSYVILYFEAVSKGELE